MAERIELTKSLRDALLSSDGLPATVSVANKEYTPERSVAAGHKGAVWFARDEYGRPRALKLCVYDDYADRSYLQELKWASRLESCPSFAHVYDAGVIELSLPHVGMQTLVCFVEEWVEGLPLDSFVKEQGSSVTSAFLLGYVRVVCEALDHLRFVGLRHDDLHASNVMMARPVGAFAEWTLKIVDTGSVKPSDRPSTKKLDDHRHFVDHLVTLWNSIYSATARTVRDRRFLDESERLLRSMLDDDPVVALRDPRQIVEQFNNAYTRASSPRQDQQEALASPFDFLSAEHIADDRLLVEIFARSCPWLSKVDGPDPCLVTGPRGCGKSTIFRWLSLKAHLHKDVAEIESFRIAGFYVSCSSDLQNRLGWLSTEALADRFRREVVHYFNLLLAREVVHTLTLILGREDSETYWGLGKAQEDAIYQFLTVALGPAGRPRIQGVSRLAQVAEAIESEMASAHSQMLRGLNLPYTTPETFLGDLTTLLQREVRHFGRKRIAFLLDDFSSHRLPDAVQAVLNRVVWERRASHVFKLSSEKFGASLGDTSQATADVTREMVEVDCGREYIALDDTDQVERAVAFSIELLDNRLKSAGYAGTADALVGHSRWEEGSLARALVGKGTGRINDQYHGLECIANICSGDVSTLLFVYRRIFERAGVTKDTRQLVPKTTQHEMIVSVSRELFEAIKTLLPFGPEMYGIVAGFGKLVRNILEHGHPLKKGRTSVPPQCPRIELDQKVGRTADALNENQMMLARELVRRAIFIQMEPGLSRHGSVTTLRWHLRRVYLPAFGAALAKNDAVKRDFDWLKLFLTNPPLACEMVWSTWPRKGARKRRDESPSFFEQ